jgi:hypothetical protein
LAAQADRATVPADPALCKGGIRRSRLVWIAVFLVGAAGLAVGIRYGRHYVIPRRFMEIEPGLFRSAQMECGPFERVVEEHAIRSVLRLYNDLLPRMDAIESKIIADRKLELLVVQMPGNGIAPFEAIDRAADIAADKSKRPLLLHCASGDRRSSTVHAAYRLKHCGWTWARTAEELEAFGFDREDGAELCVHLERYAREHLKKQGGEGK